MSLFMNKLWYDRHPLFKMLIPLSLLYLVVTRVRRWYLQRFCLEQCPVPLLVVGNITVGGVGKTPLVIELAKKMREKGMRVGIVSRGYGAKIKRFPYEVQSTDCAELVGDEPLLLAQKALCPVVIAPRRIDAVRYLLERHNSEIIISDDGLQHYRMGRAIEIAVIDGLRGLGNGYCLPAGPLREPSTRLKEVDFVIVNGGLASQGYSMELIPGQITHLETQKTITTDFLLNKPIAAVAAIGNPHRFYSTLSQLGIEFVPYSYPDHYQFKPHDLNYSESLVVMTEKDAVKCRSFRSDKMYYLPVEASLNEAFWDALWSHQQLKGYC